MKDFGIKNKILSEIMDMMDSKDGERLKKHPKLVSAKVEIIKPEGKMAKGEDMMDKEGEDMDMAEGMAHEKAEAPLFEKKEDMGEVKDSEDLSPEMIQALLEKIKDLE